MEQISIKFLIDVNIAHFMDMVEDHVGEGYPELKVDRMFFKETIDEINLSTERHFRVLTRGDDILGYYLAVIYPFLFTEKLCMTMQYIYVKPEHRGGRGFLWLMNDFEKLGGALGAYELLVGVDSGINVDKVSRIFEKRGFTFVGNYFNKKII